MTTKTQDWDAFFWERHERYLAFLDNQLQTLFENAGNKGIALTAFLSGIRFKHQLGDKAAMLKPLVDHFTYFHALSKKNAIRKTLQSLPDLKVQCLGKKSEREWELRNSQEEEGNSQTPYALDLPDSFICAVLEAEVLDERKIVKFLVRVFTHAQFLKRMLPLVEALRKEKGLAQEDFLTEEIGEIVHQRLYGEQEDQARESLQIPAAGQGQIKWLGSQKELAELFVELDRKGWVEKVDAPAIKACFTKSDTIQQVLKPSLDTKTGNAAFEGIYTTNYKAKFNKIVENKKNSKQS